MIITLITLFVALTLSSVAAYYSIIGLTAIFAAAVIPIIVMGGALEVAKIVVTVWLHKNWKRTPWGMKTYLSFAVVMLMFITSMGIFGFLSKAHMDQSVPSGDVAAKVATFDMQIQTEKDNIETNKKALAQMDAQVNELLGRTTDAQGANRAVQVRKQQAKDRKQIQTDIAASQAKIAQYQTDRAPIAAQLRKVEAEVGPIKYIAALIYGDNADSNMLEKAVRWVIIILVSVFDPLAVVMVIAANKSWLWIDEDKKRKKEEQRLAKLKEIEDKHQELIDEEQFAIKMAELKVEEEHVKHMGETPAGWHTETVPDSEAWPVYEEQPPATLTDPAVAQAALDVVFKDNPAYFTEPKPLYESGKFTMPVNTDSEYNAAWKHVEPEVEKIDLDDEEVKNFFTRGKEVAKLADANARLVEVNVGLVARIEELEAALVQIAEQPNIVAEVAEPATITETIDAHASESGYGIEFPEVATKGDTFIRTDYLPTKLYKFNGKNWIEIDKNNSSTYAYNDEYIAHLVKKISTGEYDPDLLSDAEREQIEESIRNQDF